MFAILLPVADLVAILVLTLVFYYPRHRRGDLLLSYLAINVGVLAVANALAATSINAGLGLGLFGVLAMIRLRSEELQQHEIAYYFSALALGLIGGLGASMEWIALGLMAAIVVVMGVGDSKLGANRFSRQVVVLDRAIGDPVALQAALEQVLGAQVSSFTVRRLDLVNDSTTVEATCRRGASRPLMADAGITR
ncbi:MAG: DUF4956 domain-containing protein [Propionibacteriaceae bacterium]|jgi:hypothetical protein|nr:DUF4956 domain-containing protein [Propionibacteriaceae bacterium]